MAAKGNADADLVDVPDWWHDPATVGIPDFASPGLEIGVWCADQITDQHKWFLAELPLTIEVDLGDAGRLLGFHGSPRSTNDIITATTPEDELDEMLTGIDHAVLVGGHTHVPMVRRHYSRTIINPGSVGLPFATYGYAGAVRVLNHAAYGILSTKRSEMSIELRQVAVDVDRLSQQVNASGMPHPEWWMALRE